MELVTQFYDPEERLTTHVVVVDLEVDDAQCEELAELLSGDELARANRFLLPLIRKRFVVCRAVLRKRLGELLDVSPGKIEFRYGQWGKPRVVSDRIPGVEISVSHSGDYALLAFSTRPVGIDIEVRQELFRYRSIASQVLSPKEQAEWQGTPHSKRDDLMMQLWVCKESLLKALGLGIAEGLQLVSFPIPIPSGDAFSPNHIDASLQVHLDDDGTCARNHWIDASSWKLQLLNLGSDLFAALATVPQSKTVRLYHCDGHC